MDWSQQVQVYVSWVNSQLRKCSNISPIKELSDPSMCDGTVLAVLVELISGIPVTGINKNPRTPTEKMNNIGALLKFMQSHKVKMHTIESEAVMNGDLKSIMRIVLALAAHFKPRSVRPNPTVTAIMQSAAVSLANTKHKVLRSPSITEKRFDFSVRSPSFEYRTRLPTCRDDDDDTVAASGDATKPIAITPRARSLDGTPDIPVASEIDSGCHVTPNSGPSASIERRDSESQVSPDHELSDELMNEITETRSLLEQLQQVLLSASPTDISLQSDAQTETIERETAQKTEISETSNNLVRSLEDELHQRDDQLFSLEMRLRQAAMRADSSQKEVIELRRRLADRELAFDAQKEKTERLQSHVTSLTRDLEIAMEERCRLSRDLAKSSDEREKVSRDLHDRITDLEHRMVHPGGSKSSSVTDIEQRANIFGECVERLRSNLAANDPIHHTLDQLEHCFHYQTAAVAANVPPPPPPRSSATRRRQKLELVAQPRCMWRTPSRPASLELTRDVKRQPITAIQGFPIQRLDHSMDDERSTRLLYYTDKTVTPFMVTIPKNLKEVRLADIRKATSQHSRIQCGTNRSRYLFKTRDSEFGTAIKEEVRHDDDFVPAWEDKIITWITDLPDTSTIPHG